MKKRLFSMMLVMVMVVSLTACGKEETKETTTSTVNTEIEPEEYADTVTANAEVYRDYVTLPDWKGMSVDCAVSDYEVSDDDVEYYIETMLETTATTETVTEGVTESGDTITLDYSGKLDGVAFSGGTATDVSYTIGSGKFITDLDEGLVGLTVGVETDIPCTFPEDYDTSSLAGQDVIFTVTVKGISVTTVPELTDDWVTSNAETLGLDDDVTTVDQLREYVRTYLEETATSNMQSTIFDTAYSSLTEELEVSEYPQEELDDLLNTLNSNVDAEYESYSSSYSSKEEYLTSVYSFESLDDFNEYAQEYAQEYLLQKMIITIIAADNDIVVSGDDITSTGEELAEYYGYEDYQEILDTYGKLMNAEIGYQVLYQKVVEYVAENVTVNDTSTTEESTSATAE